MDKFIIRFFVEIAIFAIEKNTLKMKKSEGKKMQIFTLSLQNDKVMLLTDFNGGYTYDVPIGIKQVMDFFGNDIPNPAQLENAINQVEDAIMPLHKILPQGYQLNSKCLDVEVVAHTFKSDMKKPFTMTQQDVETIFTRVGFIISGRPASTDNLPLTPRFAAVLLLLREVMHHLCFDDVTLV